MRLETVDIVDILRQRAEGGLSPLHAAADTIVALRRELLDAKQHLQGLRQLYDNEHSTACLLRTKLALAQAAPIPGRDSEGDAREEWLVWDEVSCEVFSNSDGFRIADCGPVNDRRARANALRIALLPQIERANARLKDQCRKLRANIDQYGGHTLTCKARHADSHDNVPTVCTCGWDAVHAANEAAQCRP